ncbi:RCC1 domain-containing protein [Haliangium sp.]
MSFLSGACTVDPRLAFDDVVQQSGEALRGDNGLSLNGLSLNGLSLNGRTGDVLGEGAGNLFEVPLDGLYINQIGRSGVGFDGVGTNQVGVSGAGTSGVSMTGIGLTGAEPGTIGAAGEGDDSFDRFSVNGFYLHGFGENGLTVAGAPLREVGLDGLTINGSFGVRRNASDGAGPVDFEPAREDALEVALYHLVGCALGEGESAKITASDGTVRIYQGLRGLAPEWRRSSLSREGEGRVLACLASSPVASQGVALNAEQELNLSLLLHYLVECALAPEQMVTIYAGDGTTAQYAGAMGLAAEWQTEALSEAGMGKVSACVAARTNGLGQTVSLSLRHPELETSPVEAELFSVHEGAFWGRLFGPDQHIEACVVSGGGLSGRVCAESEDCGFLIAGDCAEVCADYDPVNGYSRCGADGATEVINTFLNLGTRVTFGDGNLCVVDDDGGLHCWGANQCGQLADGTTIFRDRPVFVEELGHEVAEAAMGALHACARQRDGELYCWGHNGYGQLGQGGGLQWQRPVRVLGDVATFAIGDTHSCAVKTDGSAWCWGNNESGQAGVQGKGPVETPSPVSGLDAGVARLAASTTAKHTCAVMGDGGVSCWGDNAHGQLGDGSRRHRNRPTPISTDDRGQPFGEVTDMCAAGAYSCARKADGSLWCWGFDVNARPHLVADDVAPESLACGEWHACFVKHDGDVWCFGRNEHGQLGRDTEGRSDFVPAPVEGVDKVSFVNAGRTHTCATRGDGRLFCWGTDPGHEQSLFPVELSSTPIEIEIDLDQ